MTADQIDFLENIDKTFAEYTDKYLQKIYLNKNSNINRFNISLLNSFYNAIHWYFKGIDETGDNYCTADELYQLVENFNTITNTHHFVTV